MKQYNKNSLMWSLPTNLLVKDFWGGTGNRNGMVRPGDKFSMGVTYALPSGLYYFYRNQKIPWAYHTPNAYRTPREFSGLYRNKTTHLGGRTVRPSKTFYLGVPYAHQITAGRTVRPVDFFLSSNPHKKNSLRNSS